MKTSKTPGFFRPFEELKELIEKKSLYSGPPLDDALESTGKPIEKNTNVLNSDTHIDDRPDPINEKNLFIEAMADVKPIHRGDRLEPTVFPRVSIEAGNDTEIDTLQQLNILVESGEGFVVSDTSEYIEGTGYHIHPEITKRLHRGDFSIQAHIDLHGLGVDDARAAFDNFLKDAVMTGKRAVLVVHGRGLSSPDRPVLKTKMIEWITRGPWRKWIIAFSSARSFDGGPGASYILLRQRPLTRRHRKSVKKK